jgi:hypothetical protein
MKERSSKINILFPVLLTVANVVLIFAAIFWGLKYSSAYQPSPQNIPSAATPASPGELTARVESLESIQNQNLKIFEWQLDQKLLILGSIAVFISFIAGFLGFKTYNELDKVIDQEVRRALDKALYHLDPTNLRIWVVSFDQEVEFKGDAVLDKNGKQQRDEKGQPQFEVIESNVSTEMIKTRERILHTGLLNVKTIKSPDKNCFDGVTIVPVFTLKMEEDFRDFLANNAKNLDPSRAAFVLYTRDHYVSQTKTLAKYENLATANMPPTVASTILTVGRGLVNAYQTEKEEKK